MIIGSKSSFGIEINIEKSAENIYNLNVLSPLRIWIKDHSIGTLDDNTYLPVFLGQLEYKLNDLYGFFDSFSDKEELFEKIINHPDSYKKYRLGLGDSFDDYFISLFYVNYDLYILWKINEKPFFLYQESELNNVFLFQVDKSDMLSVTQEVRKMLD